MSRRVRTLVLTRSLPSSLGGGELRRRSLVRALGDLGPVFVFGLAPGGSPPRSDLAGWRSASDPRASDTPDGAGLGDLLARGESPFLARESESATAELREAVRAFAPDVAVIGGLELARYVEVLRPLVPRLVLDLDYAQARALDDMAAADHHPRRRLLWRHAAARVRQTETAALGSVDEAWVGSAGEVEPVRADAGDDLRVVVVPNVVDVASYPRSGRRDPGALVYPARFDYWPNEDAARVLVEDVVPRLDDVRLALVGVGPPPWLRAWDDPRVEVTGRVPDVRPYLAAAAAMPVPLLAGAGTRLKVLEAFAAGVPVVSTAKGVEGLGLADGVHYLRAESADEIVEALTVLRRDPEVARRCIEEGDRLVARDFSLDALRARLGGSSVASSGRAREH